MSANPDITIIMNEANSQGITFRELVAFKIIQALGYATSLKQTQVDALNDGIVLLDYTYYNWYLLT